MTGTAVTLPRIVDDRALILRAIESSADTRRVVVIIPAYNEADSIQATVRSVFDQTYSPTVVIVAANNCTDGTEERARQAGALVFLAEPNHDKKAGALNLALDFVMDELRNTDLVLVADADTRLSRDFIEVGLPHFEDSRVGGVGGAFTGRSTRSVIGAMQQIEFDLYRIDIRQHAERAFVLSGTGSLLRVEALRKVKASRDGRILPEGVGYYDTHSLTEDNELTLALRSLGYECMSPASMTTETDVMETHRALWAQRSRWYLGALRNLMAYGRKLPWHLKWTYWGQQIGLALAVFGVMAQMVLFAVPITRGAGLAIAPIWLCVALFVQAIKTILVWKMGWRVRLLMVTLEPLYNLYLLTIFCSALLKCVAGKKGDWIPT